MRRKYLVEMLALKQFHTSAALSKTNPTARDIVVATFMTMTTLVVTRVAPAKKTTDSVFDVRLHEVILYLILWKLRLARLPAPRLTWTETSRYGRYCKKHIKYHGFTLTPTDFALYSTFSHPSRTTRIVQTFVLKSRVSGVSAVPVAERHCVSCSPDPTQSD